MWIMFVFEKELIYILYYIPPFLIKYFLENKYIEDKDKSKETIDKLSKIFLIIFYIIEKKRLQSINKSQKKETTEKVKNPLIIYKHNFQKRIILISISLIICSIMFDLISMKAEKIFKIDYITEITKYTEISIFLLVDIIFFTKKMFSHHLLSIIIIMIFFFIEFISSFFQKQKILLKLATIIISNYSYSFSRILLKFINSKYYISIYLMGSLIGLFQFIYLIFNKEIIFFKANFVFFIYFISCLTLHFLYFQILEKLNPVHTLLCYKFGELIYSTLNAEIDFYTIIIFNIIWLIPSLIYLEILQLNFCGFNKNLKKNIYKRSLKDLKTANISLTSNSIQSNL